MTALVNLRNTVSGQTAEYTKEDAERILAHPFFGKVNEVVRTAKPVADLTPAEKDEPEVSEESKDVTVFGDETATKAEKKDK